MTLKLTKLGLKLVIIEVLVSRKELPLRPDKPNEYEASHEKVTLDFSLSTHVGCSTTYTGGGTPYGLR